MLGHEATAHAPLLDDLQRWTLHVPLNTDKSAQHILISWFPPTTRTSTSTSTSTIVLGPAFYFTFYSFFHPPHLFIHSSSLFSIPGKRFFLTPREAFFSTSWKVCMQPRRALFRPPPRLIHPALVSLTPFRFGLSPPLSLPLSGFSSLCSAGYSRRYPAKAVALVGYTFPSLTFQLSFAWGSCAFQLKLLQA